MSVKLIKVLAESASTALVPAETWDGLWSATPDQIVSVFSEFGPFSSVEEVDGWEEGRSFTVVGGGKRYRIDASEILDYDSHELDEYEDPAVVEYEVEIREIE